MDNRPEKYQVRVARDDMHVISCSWPAVRSKAVRRETDTAAFPNFFCIILHTHNDQTTFLNISHRTMI